MGTLNHYDMVKVDAALAVSFGLGSESAAKLANSG